MTKDLRYIIKRVIIGVLISIILMLIGSFKVNAQTINTAVLGGSSSTTNSAFIVKQWSNNNAPFKNSGSGTLLFNLALSAYGYQTPLPRTINITTSAGTFPCDFNNALYAPYVDNNNYNSYSTYSVTCPINSGSGITMIYVSTNAPNSTNIYYWYVSDSMSFISESVANYSDITNGLTENSYYTQQTITQSKQDIINSINTAQQEQHQDMQQVANNIQEVNNTLKDETPPSNEDLDSILNNKSNNNNVANLIMFVPNIFASVGSGLSSNCSGSIQLGNLMGTNLILTCIRPQNYLGGTLWTIIDFMFLFGLFLAFRKWVVNIYNDLTSLKEVQFN